MLLVLSLMVGLCGRPADHLAVAHHHTPMGRRCFEWSAPHVLMLLLLLLQLLVMMHRIWIAGVASVVQLRVLLELRVLWMLLLLLMAGGGERLRRL